MNLEEAKKKIDELRKKLEYYANKYYDEDKPEITDYEYDMMMNRLKALEKEFPELITRDSLTQKVGGHVKEGFKQVVHEVPLQSLQDIFSFEELKDFDTRVRKVAEENNEELKYVVETKIDGLSTALKYENGVFVQGATRGNGLIGEDVTDNLKTISHIPKELKEKIDITVRGEVFIGTKEFEKMNEERTKVFEKELSYINNPRYKEGAQKLISLLPDYFFEVPASSTGKYHPSFALGSGGLVRHTKVAVRFAYEMFNDESITGAYSKNEKDLMIISLIMHDGLKSGLEKSQYTKFEHPLLVCDYIKENKDKLTFTDKEIEFMCHVISSHMGPWNTNNYSNIVLPKPESKFQRFVHMCDYLASRKVIDVKFDSDNNIEE